MTWHEDLYVWGEVERIRAMKFGADAELHQDTLLQQMAARIGKPNAGCLLTHAAVGAYFKKAVPCHGLIAYRLAKEFFINGWFWDEGTYKRTPIPNMKFRSWETYMLKAITCGYGKPKGFNLRAESGRKGGEARAKNLSPERRSAIASKAARKRWELRNT